MRRFSATLVDGRQGSRTKLHLDIDGMPRQYERWIGKTDVGGDTPCL